MIRKQAEIKFFMMAPRETEVIKTNQKLPSSRLCHSITGVSALPDTPSKGTGGVSEFYSEGMKNM